MSKINKEIFKDITILYVEDDVSTMEEISFFLKKYVKELLVAKNGKEGLELFKQHNPDMVITDIQMPVMNGLEMAEEILKINCNIPIAVTTAYSDGEFLIRAIDLGIDKYIVKPLNLKEILAVIQKSLKLQIKSKTYEDYIQFILDSNPTFMFVMNSEKIEYANKKFLNLLGYDDSKSFKEDESDVNTFIKLIGVETNLNWIDYIMQNTNKKHLVKIHKMGSEECIKREFYVSYKYFEYRNKGIFVFTDTNEEKLGQINKIAKDLIESTEDEQLIQYLNKILKLSTKEE